MAQHSSGGDIGKFLTTAEHTIFDLSKIKDEGEPHKEIEDVYRGVINDVINHVKEAFLDENVDVDVLFHLKEIWEGKIRESGAVDLDGPKQPPVRAPPAQRAATINRLVQPSSSTPTPTQTSVIQNAAQLSTVYGHVELPQQQHQPQAVQIQAHQLVSEAANLLTDHQQIQQQTQQVQQALNNVSQIVNIGAADFSQQQQHVALAAHGVTLPPGYLLLSGSGNAHYAVIQSNNAFPSSTSRVPQLDGGAPGMSDSSTSEEEDDNEDISKLKRFQNLGSEKLDDEDDGEEEPLNSNDDQSDDEDLETLFEADNVVVCQFEKVHRARNKWKFTLKDGIMRIDGKEYCFQKCSGDAEW